MTEAAPPPEPQAAPIVRRKGGRGPRHELETPAGRKRAWDDLLWADHGFLRAAFQNFHWISPEMARANQPSPAHVRRYAAMGFRTIVNLRGENDSGHYLLEKEACAEAGVALVEFPVKSRDAPRKEQVLGAADLFERIAYPALMHCKSGADRAGLMGVLYLHFRRGVPISAAMEQLSFKYLHVRQGKTGIIDFFFEHYGEATRENGKSFRQWVEEDYDVAALKAQFMSQWWANILVDKILRRE
ncbi:MAG: sulfur transferase domain-containing protein [Hyphomonadaceae bacterium]